MMLPNLNSWACCMVCYFSNSKRQHDLPNHLNHAYRPDVWRMNTTPKAVPETFWKKTYTRLHNILQSSSKNSENLKVIRCIFFKRIWKFCFIDYIIFVLIKSLIEFHDELINTWYDQSMLVTTEFFHWSSYNSILRVNASLLLVCLL